MPAKIPCEVRQDVSREGDAIFAEIFAHGTGNIDGLRKALAVKQVRMTSAEIEGYLRSLRSKGRVRRTNWQWHLTDAAVNYLR
jgi:hypothetical protein